MSRPTLAAGQPNEARRHCECPAIDIGRTLFSAAVVIATVILSAVASREIYLGLVRPTNERSGTPLYGEGLALPAQPRLEGIEMMSATSAINSDGNDDRLQKYGWVDRDKKIVHIPIQKAMELAIDEGWLRSTSPPRDNRQQPTDNSKPTDKKNSAR